MNVLLYCDQAEDRRMAYSGALLRRAHNISVAWLVCSCLNVMVN